MSAVPSLDDNQSEAMLRELARQHKAFKSNGNGSREPSVSFQAPVSSDAPSSNGVANPPDEAAPTANDLRAAFEEVVKVPEKLSTYLKQHFMIVITDCVSMEAGKTVFGEDIDSEFRLRAQRNRENLYKALRKEDNQYTVATKCNLQRKFPDYVR